MPFLKNILLYAIKLEASFNPSWKKIKVEEKSFFIFFLDLFFKFDKIGTLHKISQQSRTYAELQQTASR